MGKSSGSLETGRQDSVQAEGTAVLSPELCIEASPIKSGGHGMVPTVKHKNTGIKDRGQISASKKCEAAGKQWGLLWKH